MKKNYEDTERLRDPARDPVCDTDHVRCCKEPSHQAYQLLHFIFTLAPIIAGLDKFFNFLTVWGKYLSSPFNVFGNVATTMMVVGAIEIIVGIGIWFKPRIFAYILALWLLGIIINLLILGNFYDVALRDLGLLFGALALGRLSLRCDCRCGSKRCCT